MIGIYSIIAPDNNVYIGQSSNVNSRIMSHKKLNNKGTPLHTSLLKYGVESHTFDVIEQCDRNELLSNEQFYMDYFKFLEFNLLNVHPASCRTYYSFKNSDEAKIRMITLKTSIPINYIIAYQNRFGYLSLKLKKRVRDVWHTRTVDEGILNNFEKIAKEAK